MIYEILIISSIVAGGFSAYVAEQKNRSGLNWFILGAAFSVLALIALIAIPKLEKESNRSQIKREDITQFKGDPDVRSEAYQLYLTKKFNIEKNTVLEKYVVADQLFNTLEDALKHTDILNKELEEHSKLLKLKEYENEINNKIKVEEQFNKFKKGSALSISILLIMAVGLISLFKVMLKL